MKKALFWAVCCAAGVCTWGCDDSGSASGDPCEGVTCDHGVCSVMLSGSIACRCDTGYVNSDDMTCVLQSSGSGGGSGTGTGTGGNPGTGTGTGGNPGTGTQPETNACSGQTCSWHGTCSVVNGSAKCVCDQGYAPQNLSCVAIQTVSCEGQTCSGHGVCSISGNEISCKCEAGYRANGLSCESVEVTGPVTAEDWARARIAGTVSTEEAFNAIAYSSGFPVVTDDHTLIFMHWYNEGNWAVAGDFNNWQPQNMTHDNDIWYVEVPMPADATSKGFYKFVNNGTQYVSDPWALRYTYTNDGEISYIVQPKEAHLMRWLGFESPQGLKTRTIRAYIPANFDPNTAHDVLYAHDGQNLFGPGGEYGSWKVEEAMATIKGNFIVVGIDNTSDRMSEYVHVDESNIPGYGGYKALGSKYAEFVNQSVRPFIEQKFKTTGKRGLMGSSLGGLISLYIPLLYPGEYKVALALSPTTAWGRFSDSNGTTIEDLYVKAGKQPTILYLDNGGYDPGNCSPLDRNMANNDESNTDNFCFTRHFVDTMANSLNYEWEKDLFHYFDKGAEHTEAAWAKRIKDQDLSPLIVFMNAQ